jgi:threonine/homoserine/homoserine lactone efflux protein
MFITQGLVLGLYAALVPGPLQFFLFSQTLRVGWRRTLPAALAPLLSDGPIILLFLLVLSQAPGWFLSLLRIVGGLFILYLAWGAYAAFRSPEAAVEPPANAARQSILRATLMNLLNPNVYIFWGTIGAPIVLDGWQTSFWLGAAFILAMYGVMVPANAGLIVLFGTTGQLKPNVRRFISAALALLLLGVAVYQVGMGAAGLVSPVMGEG